MGLQIRDERQMKALTGLSQAQFDSLLPVFSDLYRAAQQHAYEEGSQSGTRRRRPGGGSKGKLPTMVEKLLFVLYYYKTYPTFDVLGTHGVGHMTVDTCGKPYLPTLHTAFKAHRMSAEVPRSSKESWCPNMAIRLA